MAVALGNANSTRVFEGDYHWGVIWEDYIQEVIEGRCGRNDFL